MSLTDHEKCLFKAAKIIKLLIYQNTNEGLEVQFCLILRKEYIVLYNLYLEFRIVVNIMIQYIYIYMYIYDDNYVNFEKLK